MSNALMSRSWTCVMRAGPLVALVLGTVGCSPALDWRETSAANGLPSMAAAGGNAAATARTLRWLMPCKPQLQQRSVQLAETSVQMALWSCVAGNRTWALAMADVRDPSRLGIALPQLMRAAEANVRGVSPQPLALSVPGATPHANSARMQWQGVLPGGQATWMQVAVFAHGTWVVQASVLDPERPGDAAQTFMESIRFAL